jgi:hypothetical protein
MGRTPKTRTRLNRTEEVNLKKLKPLNCIYVISSHIRDLRLGSKWGVHFVMSAEFVLGLQTLSSDESTVRSNQFGIENNVIYSVPYG